MSHSIRAIAEATGLRAEGDLSLTVERPAPPHLAGAQSLAMAMSERYADALVGTEARAAVLWDGADWQALGLKAALFAPRPRVALAGINDIFAAPHDLGPGVHPTAVVAPDAALGEDVRVGPFAVIGAGARIGDRARILGQAWIGPSARIGADALLYPGVRIGHGCTVGARFIAQPNAVIGSDGFSFVTPEAGSAETARRDGTVRAGQNARILRIASLGAVTLGDDVEIGALSAIDRGTIADTVIGSGTKIDNLVQIGHNVRVGENCMLCGQVGIAGSTTVGDRVVLGGRTGVGDNLTIGSDVVTAGGSLVGSNIPDRRIMMGAPAMPRDEFQKQYLALRRLPRLIARVEALREKLGL